MNFDIWFLVFMIIVNSVFWISVHFFSGYLVHFIPKSFYTGNNPLFKERFWEFNGKLYEKVFLIKLWKDRLPEAGELLSINPFNKKKFLSRDKEYISRFITETCRAELSHLLPFLFLPISFVWNNFIEAMVVMVLYCVVANIPFVMIQRYNRIRLSKLNRKSF
ncbi:MAG: hypothetical protein N2712_00265 [Brevinematales bacterium]|nr:hypothetical protein [Brevinematales bacterium]